MLEEMNRRGAEDAEIDGEEEAKVEDRGIKMAKAARASVDPPLLPLSPRSPRLCGYLFL
jgi:hypothetical protein